jgi:competence ComEA-like helix-hairpin-helix protein
VNEHEDLTEGTEEEQEIDAEGAAKEAIRESVTEAYRSGKSEEGTDLSEAPSGEGQGEGADGETEPQLEEEADLSKIDLNRATAEDLRTLPGIGPTLAQRIVAYRDEVHSFMEPGELMAVSGISEATYQQIADRLMVGRPSEAEAEVEPEVEVEVGAEPEAEPEEEAAGLEEAPEPEELLPQPEGEVAEEEGRIPPEPEVGAAEPETITPPPPPSPKPPPPRPAAPPPRGYGWGCWRSTTGPWPFGRLLPGNCAGSLSN